MKSFLLHKVLPMIGGITALLLLPRVSALLGPEIPSVPTLVPTTSAPSTQTGPRTFPPPLPEGFPSMLRPPPQMTVAPGEPQPISTRYGLTYDIPPDWTNDYRSTAGWSSKDDRAIFGAIGHFGEDYCSAIEGAQLAMSGAAGSRDLDLLAVASKEIRAVEWIFDDDAGTLPTVEYAEPVWFEVAGSPAVRLSAHVTDIPQVSECDPEAALFDIIATPGYATAETMVLMVEIHEGIDGAYDVGVADEIIGTLRPT
ncbi:hypothetical protein [Rhodococcus pyridinivorans]|uniref:hypothetical protein n=3 Tax=Nocardiaceae TaxID=85025 RepID=UPI001E305BC1|nr:hypothetical protein [Rhodococcus pyridinivorans]